MNRLKLSLHALWTALAVLSCPAVLGESATDTSEQVSITEVVDGAAVFGDAWPGGEAMTIDQAIDQNTETAPAARVHSGRITQVCQKKGCWMILEKDGKFARVDFNSHAFFIPRDSRGPAEVYGVLTLKTLSDSKRQHLAEDGAEGLPEQVWELVATSVKIG